MITYKFGLLILLLSCVQGCSHTMSEEDKELLKRFCDRKETSGFWSIKLSGFEYEEVSSITVLEIFKGDIVHKYDLHLNKVNYRYQASDRSYELNFHRKFHIDYNYEFALPNGDKYMLHDMKNELHPTFSMFTEDYSCWMGQYSINDKIYRESSVTILKGNEYKYEF